MTEIIESASHKEKASQRKQNRIKIFILILIILVLFFGLVFGCLWVVSYFKWPTFVYNKFFTEKPAKLWAVYLSAGNVPTTYYGEIAAWRSEYLVLKNPAYIDVRQATEATSSEPTVTFRRLSNEFYKPKPEAKIFKQNIVFLQELATDSPIYEAYKQVR